VRLWISELLIPHILSYLFIIYAWETDITSPYIRNLNLNADILHDMKAELR